jgi:class 3 adenylate cyclase
MNVTARIEDLCGPNELLVAETTKDALRQSFKLETRGAHSLKGIEHPIHIFAVDWSEDTL